MLTPAFADSSETIAALCMRIGARHIFGIKPIAPDDIAPSANWWPHWPGPACENYGSGQLDLATAHPYSLTVVSFRHAPAVLALSRRAHGTCGRPMVWPDEEECVVGPVRPPTGRRLGPTASSTEPSSKLD